MQRGFIVTVNCVGTCDDETALGEQILGIDLLIHWRTALRASANGLDDLAGASGERCHDPATAHSGSRQAELL
jgi:hypothetical protein